MIYIGAKGRRRLKEESNWNEEKEEREGRVQKKKGRRRLEEESNWNEE